MALLLSSCGVGAVINLDALKTYATFSTKKSLTCKKNKIVASNQGVKATVRASSVVVTEPLTKEALITYFASGCKPKEMWRIGTEHEKVGFEVKTLRRMKYEKITALLNGISERFNWDKVMENGKGIGLKQGMQNISLEPGGQLELSGAPLETLHQTCDELHSHLYQVKTVADELGIGFIGIGFEPKSCLGDGTIVPKIATALFANSPLSNGFLSMRSHLYINTDKNRTGMMPFVFDNSFGFERYVEYALDLPMCLLLLGMSCIICTLF